MEALLHVRATVIQCRDRATLLWLGMDAEEKGNIHLRHDEFIKKKQYLGALKRSQRGSHKVVGDLCTVGMLCGLKITKSLMQASSSPLKLYFHISLSAISAFEHKTEEPSQS